MATNPSTEAQIVLPAETLRQQGLERREHVPI
jgi:hypothetical protein